jgi:hypothetical protein
MALLRIQFFRLAPLRFATLRLTFEAFEFSKFAPFKLQPSKLDLNPLGSSKLQFVRTALSILEQRPFIPEFNKKHLKNHRGKVEKFIYPRAVHYQLEQMRDRFFQSCIEIDCRMTDCC